MEQFPKYQAIPMQAQVVLTSSSCSYNSLVMNKYMSQFWSQPSTEYHYDNKPDKIYTGGHLTHSINTKITIIENMGWIPIKVYNKSYLKESFLSAFTD